LNGRIDEGSLLGVSAIELGKTVAMIRNPFNLLKPQFRKIAGRRSASLLARDGIKRASSIWLEHRYGWNAFYQDIKAIAKTTAKMFRDEGPTDDGDGLDAITNKEEFNGVYQDVIYNDPGSSASWLPENSANWYNEGAAHSLRLRLRTLSSRAVYRVGCKQKVDAAIRWSRSKRLINAYGLDSASIVSTLWELVPFSFVVDWFVDPLGMWRNPAVSRRLHQSDVKGLCASLKIEGNFSVDVRLVGCPFRDDPDYVYRSKIGGSPGVIEDIMRVSNKRFYRYANVPVEGGFESVFADKDLSFIQRTSGIALIAQKALK